MKSLRRTRDRLALLFAILAAASIGAGIFGAVATNPSSGAWLFPIAGLAGYILCAKKAMDLWQGRGRTLPRRPLPAVCIMSAGLLTLAAAPAAQAQQTLFNVPSADVLAKGTIYLEVDHLYRPSDPYFQVFTVRGVYGLGANVEAGVNVGGVVAPGRSTPNVVPNIKWQPYKGERFAVTTGAHGLFYLRGSEDGDPAAFGYTHASYRFPTKTRVTAGAWAASDGYAGADSEAGGLFILEQPVTDKVTLGADWFTGENGLGYLTPGLVATLGPWTIYASYSFKNGDSKSNAILTELGFTF